MKSSPLKNGQPSSLHLRIVSRNAPVIPPAIPQGQGEGATRAHRVAQARWRDDHTCLIGRSGFWS